MADIIHKHFIIHKPYGYLSQFINNKKRKKKLLGDLYSFPNNAMAVGRLDVKSEGLLLLTTDGFLSHTICSSKVEKEYYVQVDGVIDKAAIEALNKGVEIGVEGKRYMTKPSKTSILVEKPELEDRWMKIRDERHGPTSWISITINEGKFRQVRKMTSAVGFPTLRLIRVRIGKIELKQLKAGSVIPVENLSF